MPSSALITFSFVEEQEGWRAADLLPGEPCLYKGIPHIKLGGGVSEIEFHYHDPHRIKGGEEGARQKKHLFFNLKDAQVVTIVGREIVCPRKFHIQIQEAMTFTLNDAMPLVQVPKEVG